MKAGSDRKYTAEFRDAAVKQVIQGGRGMAAVARSLEMSNKTLANWVHASLRGAPRTTSTWSSRFARASASIEGATGVDA